MTNSFFNTRHVDLAYYKLNRNCSNAVGVDGNAPKVPIIMSSNAPSAADVGLVSRV